MLCHWGWEPWSGWWSVPSHPPPLLPSLLHLGKANSPNPCPATPIMFTLHTHSLSDTGFIWAWNRFLLSARMHHLCLNVILIHPLFPLFLFFIFFIIFLNILSFFFLFLCHRCAPFCFHGKCPALTVVPQNTFPGDYDQKWLEIPLGPIFYLTAWIRSK